MPNRSFTPGEKSTAIALARLTTIEQTSVTLNIDKRTLRSWLSTAPPATDADAWRAAEQLAQQQLLTNLATGKVKHPTFLATIAGIAGRNIRFGDLIRRREARREAEQEPPPPDNPIRAAIASLEPRRQALVSMELRAALEEPPEPDDATPGSVSAEEGDAAFLAYIADVASLSEEDLTERLEEARAADQPGQRVSDPPDALADLRDAIDEIDGPAGDGNVPPALPVVLVEDGSPEGTRSRLAVNVTPGAPEPIPEPEIGKDGTWVEVDRGEPWQWEAWRRYET